MVAIRDSVILVYQWCFDSDSVGSLSWAIFSSTFV